MDISLFLSIMRSYSAKYFIKMFNFPNRIARGAEVKK
jgi:hypothetical protein